MAYLNSDNTRYSYYKSFCGTWMGKITELYLRGEIEGK